MLARTKQITVEAVQWRGDNEGEMIAFFPEGTRFVWRGSGVDAHTEGDMIYALPNGGWVVRRTGEEELGLYTDEYFHYQFEPIEAPEENEGGD